MTFPSIILGIFIAAIPGNIFHFWRGGGFKWLVLYNFLAIVGFWIGHFLGSLQNLTFLRLGPLNLGMGLIGSIVFLFGGYWLSMASVEIKK
jgi:hypothetical protein